MFRKYLVLLIPAFLFIVVPVFALTSSNFLAKAQRYINNNCSRKFVSDQNSLLCFLFDKSSEQDSRIEDLTQRVNALETKPVTNQVIFFQNFNNPLNSPWKSIPSGYSTMILNVTTTGSIAGYDIHYTNDPNSVTDTTGFTDQIGVSCNSSVCPQTTIPILGSYYRLSAGTESGLLTAVGLLNP